MSAPSTVAHDAAERRGAARALLVSPLLNAQAHAEQLAVVRRHAAALKSTFATVLGYHLVVETSFARLIKAPLSTDTPTRPAHRSGGTSFSPRTYAYVALVLAGLLTPEAGEQVVLSQLVEQLRADAVTAGLTVDDTLAERRNLVAAIELLVTWGVLAETDGTAAAWGERREEALLTVSRALLPHLLAQPLHALTAPAQLWDGDDGPEQPRRSLRRKLVENPLVRREDLPELERDALSRERTEISRVLEDAFGLQLEVRAEGALAYDPDDELTDVAFPGPGTVRQAALLLLDALVDTLRPKAGVETTAAGRSGPGVLAPWRMVEDNLTDLAQRNSKVWSSEHVDDVDRLRDEVVAVLQAVSLATATDDGLVIHPAAARYRPQPQHAPARTRAVQRLDDDTAATDESAADLFTDSDSETT